MASLRLVAASLSLLLAALAAQGAAPGCGCEVSSCCKHGAFKSTHCWPFCSLGSPARVFDSLAGRLPESYNLAHEQVSTTLSPTCSFLYLIPGAFDEGGLCDSGRNATVCEAISNDTHASDRLESGRSTLSVFAEPGTCEELEADVCWESKGSNTYSWYSFDWNDELVESGWCKGWEAFQITPFPALAWSVAVVPEGLQVRARWVNDANFGACSGEYADGLQATITADGWRNGSGVSPRWRCFDVENDTSSEAVGPTSNSRIIIYSTGDLYRPSNESDMPSNKSDRVSLTVSGSDRVRIAALALASSAAALAKALV